MTPEKRAERLFPEGSIYHAVQRERVAKAIRSAENAALERAAELVHRGPRDTIYTSMEAAIRSLKSRAPRRPR